MWSETAEATDMLNDLISLEGIAATVLWLPGKHTPYQETLPHPCFWERNRRQEWKYMPFMTLTKFLAFKVAIPIKALFKVHAINKEAKWVLEIITDTGSNNIRFALKYCHEVSHGLTWLKQKLDAGALKTTFRYFSFLWHYISWREIEYINIYKPLVVTYRYSQSSIFPAHNFHVG